MVRGVREGGVDENPPHRLCDAKGDGANFLNLFLMAKIELLSVAP
jgi:hypothetical protein